MKAAPEDQPAGVSVVPEVTSEGSDGQHGVADSRALWQRLLGDGLEHLQLFRGERCGRRGLRIVSGKVPEQEQSPCDGREDRESVQQAGRAFKLPTLVLAAGFERLEEFFDHPARPIAVDREGDRCRRIDRQARQKKPLDRRLPVGGFFSDTWMMLTPIVADAALPLSLVRGSSTAIAATLSLAMRNLLAG